MRDCVVCIYRDAKGVEVVTENEEQRIKDVAGQFCRFQMNNLCVSAALRRLCDSCGRLTSVLSPGSATSITTVCAVLT